MTDAEVEARSRRRAALVVGAWLVLPGTFVWTAAAVVGFRALFGWWPWSVAWTGPRYR